MPALNPLPVSFYRRDDVVTIARELLGKKLCTLIDGQYTAGMIVETEAYRAPEDPASHAYDFRRTPRTEVMFAAGGVAYVYVIYGIYELFNVVTSVEGTPHAVLIRGLEPLEGLDIMQQRRQLEGKHSRLSSGPGLLSQALGITRAYTGLSLDTTPVWIEDFREISPSSIVASPRVGMGKTVFEPYFSMPWRFRVQGNRWVSPAR